jgi:hypothetical protein
VQPNVDVTVELDLKMSLSLSMRKSTVMAVVRLGIENKVRRRGYGFMVMKRVWLQLGVMVWKNCNAKMR